MWWQVVESAKRAGLTNDQCKQREAEQAAKAARKDGKIADKELNRLLFTIPLTKKQKEVSPLPSPLQFLLPSPQEALGTCC